MIRSELRGLSSYFLISPDVSLTEERSVWDLRPSCAPLTVSFPRGRRKPWLAKMWDKSCKLAPGWGNEESAGVSGSKARALLWREGRDNRSLMIKSQIKSLLLSNKHRRSYYQLFVEEPVVGAEYQVLQAWQRHKFIESSSLSIHDVFLLRRMSTSIESLT